MPFDQIPPELSKYPTVPLLSPTNIVSLPRLTSALVPSSSNTSLYLYPEYLTSALFPGGSKTRKLEYVLPQALDQGCDTLITVGGVQSNHARQVAAVAARLGLKCILVLSELVKPMRTKSEYNALGNALIERLTGAEIRVLRHGEQRDEVVNEARTQVERRGGKAYYIPSGASMDERGGLGYAGGSTLGGILAGLKLAEKTNKASGQYRRKVIGVDTTVRDSQETKELVLGIARRTGKLLGLKDEELPSSDDVIVDGRWAAEAYGVLDKATKETIHEVAQREGILIDPVYTGKAMRGLMEAMKGGEVKGNILFLHTGGQIAISAYPAIDEN